MCGCIGAAKEQPGHANEATTEMSYIAQSIAAP